MRPPDADAGAARPRACGRGDPPCTVCGGIQKSATVAFGESLDGAVLREAVEAARTCQLFLAIGTSLTVQPAASLFDFAQGAGASCMIINAEPTIYDQSADAVVHGSIGEVLPAIVTSALA